MKIDPGQLGVKDIRANISNSPGETLIFPQPPDKLKFILCRVSIGPKYEFQYPFLQVG